ncbi:MAG: bifunctional DNA-formamidopyrimidine glycosylase/DNA-(apurinic or apyrimidinic site) lyase [Gemmatimonadaceae bacterium]
MPELPEVEFAARLARDAIVGRVIGHARVLHPAQRRALPDAVAATLRGDVVQDVIRRGKYQRFLLQSGRSLLIHFRMTGDWSIGRAAEPPPAHARFVLEFIDGTRLALDDTRALSTVSLFAAGIDPLPALGPEATSDEFDALWLYAKLRLRRGPIKPVLLDQALVAGIGNIYASEALWYAKVDPRRAANRLTRPALAAVAAGVKRALQKALDHPERYYGAGGISDRVRFNVYDREGRPCRRCGADIRRIVQAARSTFYCPECQKTRRREDER